jgi:hypothetical protein
MNHRKVVEEFGITPKAHHAIMRLARFIFEKYSDHRFEPAELRSYIKQLFHLALLVKNDKQLAKYDQQLFDEVEMEGISAFKIGSYMAKRLKNNKLPS